MAETTAVEEEEAWQHHAWIPSLCTFLHTLSRTCVAGECVKARSVVSGVNLNVFSQCGEEVAVLFKAAVFSVTIIVYLSCVYSNN